MTNDERKFFRIMVAFWAEYPNLDDTYNQLYDLTESKQAKFKQYASELIYTVNDKSAVDKFLKEI